MASNPSTEAGRPSSFVRCEDISVSFGPVLALDAVSLTLELGRIHAVLGENGAGKTTLARTVAGMLRPDAGRVSLDDRELTLGDVVQARRAGIEMVHQDFALPPSFTVAETLELFSTRVNRLPLYRRRVIEASWRAALESSGLSVSPDRKIRDLPIETLQDLEITRALASQARILVLDEPTAVLAPSAIDRLFARLKRLREEGVTIIIVLHKLREVLAIAETVTVLRQGRVVLPPTPIGHTSAVQLSNLMVGAAESHVETAEIVNELGKTEAAVGAALRIENVTSSGSQGERGLDGISLLVSSGELLGIAGVEGNGQRSLVRVVVGLERPLAGHVYLGGRLATMLEAKQRRQLGVRLVPFDRKTEGVSLSSSLWENVAIRDVVSLAGGMGGWLNVGRERRRAGESLDRWQVRYRHVNQPARELSGGNLQRLILARELEGGVRLLVAAQPTRGLDVAGTQFVHTTLRALRSAGAGILLVSSDLDELVELSDRIVVFLGGSVVAEFGRPFSLQALGAAMTGGQLR